MSASHNPALMEALARALFDAAENIPGASVPVIAAEPLAEVVLRTIREAGFMVVPREDNEG